MTDTAHSPRLLATRKAEGLVQGLTSRIAAQDPHFELDLNPLTMADIGAALRAGWADFAASWRETRLASVIVPLLGVMLLGVDFLGAPLSLLLPLIAGFALVGPLAAIGFYEVSLRREMGETVDLFSAFHVLERPALGAVGIMGAVLALIFAAWLGTVFFLFEALIGHAGHATLPDMLRAVATTAPGHLFVLLSVICGGVMALAVLATSVVTMPMLIDRTSGLTTAIRASLRLTAQNPKVVLSWGAIVAATLFLAMLPALLGLLVALPVLGHASWHLYRRAVV